MTTSGCVYSELVDDVWNRRRFKNGVHLPPVAFLDCLRGSFNARNLAKFLGQQHTPHIMRGLACCCCWRKDFITSKLAEFGLIPCTDLITHSFVDLQLFQVIPMPATNSTAQPLPIASSAFAVGSSTNSPVTRSLPSYDASCVTLIVMTPL